MDGTPINEYISQYSRAQCIKDGQLIDVTNWAKRSGMKFPVAVTRAVWFGIIEPDEDTTAVTPKNAARLGSCLSSLVKAARATSGDRISFQFEVTIKGEPQTFTLYATLMPGDDFEPVITVMNLDED
jgi:hypothetical protein